MSIKFTLEMDGIRSVIDSTMPRENVKALILEEVELRFKEEIVTFGEDRIIGGPGEWHLRGRYVEAC